MVVLDPSLSGLTPRWVVYHDISFPGSLALKNSPPITVTRAGIDSWILGFCLVRAIRPTDWSPGDFGSRLYFSLEFCSAYPTRLFWSCGSPMAYWAVHYPVKLVSDPEIG